MLEYEEKREYARMETNCRMTFRHVDSEDSHDAICLNLSGAGLLFAANSDIALGQILEGTIYPEITLTPPMTAFIEIIRSTHNSERDKYLLAGMIKGIRG